MMRPPVPRGFAARERERECEKRDGERGRFGLIRSR